MFRISVLDRGKLVSRGMGQGTGRRWSRVAGLKDQDEQNGMARGKAGKMGMCLRPWKLHEK